MTCVCILMAARLTGNSSDSMSGRSTMLERSGETTCARNVAHSSAALVTCNIRRSIDIGHVGDRNSKLLSQ